MDEEILAYLIKVGATSQETARTLKELMDESGRNLDTVVLHTKLLLRDRKVQVSNAAMLSRTAQHVWPVASPGRMEVTGEQLASAQREWKEQNFYPLTVWLGPVILQELEEKSKADEMRELLREAIARPQTIGNQFVGAATHVTTGPVVQGSSSFDSSNRPAKSAANTATKTATISGVPIKGTTITIIIGVVVGLLILLFWEQIKQFF